MNTNSANHIAINPQSDMLRGGRVTKVKGRDASYSPALGLTVSVVALGASLMFAQPARAANECGAEALGPDVITCNADGVPVADDGVYEAGITYTNSDGLTLNINAPAIVVASPGVSVQSSGANTNDIAVNGTSFSVISTTGASQHGLYARNAGTAGNATVTQAAGLVTTTGDNARGLYALNQGNGTATATLTDGDVSTAGIGAYGLLAQNTLATNEAATSAAMEGGSVTTTGDNARGLYALNQGNGTATATLTDGDVSTSGDTASGLRAGVRGTGSAAVVVNGGTVTTSGNLSYGVHTVGSNNNTIDIAAGAVIDASGSGIAIRDGDSGLDNNADGFLDAADNVNGQLDAFVASFDADHDGFRDDDDDDNGFLDVDAGGDNATTALPALPGADGVDEVASGFQLDANGDQILDGNGDPIPVSTGGSGNVTVTTAGTVTGDAILGLGDDTFNLVGGSYDGDIYGDDALASANDGNDTFNWTGGTWNSSFYGQNGSDTATIDTDAVAYDPNHHILDGGDDASSADGWVDTLNMLGATVDLNGATTLNWEVINFSDNATVSLTDVVGETVNVAAGGSTTITGASEFVDVVGSALDDTIAITGDATITGDVTGGDGNDAITIDSTGGVGGDVLAGAGDDTVTLADSSVGGNVDGGDGTDALTADASSIGGDVTGFENIDGTMLAIGGDVVGTDADDTISLTDSTVAGSIDAGAGDDAVTLANTDVTGDVLGGDGDDAFTVTDSSIGGNLDGGAGENTLAIEDSTVGGAILNFADLSIGAGGTLSVTGDPLVLTGDLSNNGTLTMVDGMTDDLVAVGGNYSGNGILAIDANLDTGASDQMIIVGDVTGGTTTVNVNDTGSGVGFLTTGDGIQIITVGGTAAPGSFVLGSPSQVGAFDYSVGQGANGSFFIQSTFQSSVPMLEVYGQTLLGLTDLQSHRQRTGIRHNPLLDNGSTSNLDGRGHTGGIWGQIEGSNLEQVLGTSTTGSSFDQDVWKARLGADVALSSSDESRLVLGVGGHIGGATTDVASPFGSAGRIDTDTSGFNLGLTWYHASGFYADLQGGVNFYDSDLDEGPATIAATGVDSTGYMAGFELGYSAQVGDGWMITPQVQLEHARVDYDGFAVASSTTAVLADGDQTSLRGRVGMTLENEKSWVGEGGSQGSRNLFLSINLHHDFEGDGLAFVTGTPLNSQIDQTWGEVGLGGTFNLSNTVSIFGEANYATSLSNVGDSNRLDGRIGLRVGF